ncbi:hypothetical protein [Amycolatopsis sp. NPDC059657]|uniref:hypothetical protein n=1 Tax=Amycolatopsis sp. NPDC059657 TaxID=3346899 RepID=UPI0036709961
MTEYPGWLCGDELAAVKRAKSCGFSFSVRDTPGMHTIDGIRQLGAYREKVELCRQAASSGWRVQENSAGTTVVLDTAGSLRTVLKTVLEAWPSVAQSPDEL